MAASSWLHGADEHHRQYAGEAHRRLHATAAVLYRLRPDLVPERHRPAGAGTGDYRSAFAGALARERGSAELGRFPGSFWLQGGPADGSRTGLSSLVSVLG